MSNTKQCPECLVSLESKANRCLCGWILQSNQIRKTDDNCQYRSGNLRCPSIGASCKKIRGVSEWYCSEHALAMDNPEKSEKILHEAIKNYQHNLAKRQDWRVKLINDLLMKNK